MPSRRKTIELTDAEIDEYLATSQTLIIVSNSRNGFPHPMPMWFYADADRNCFCTTYGKSQKVFNWQRDPRASLLIESGTVYSALKGLVIYAQTQIIDDLDVVANTMVRINTKGRGISEEKLEQQRNAVVRTAAKRVVLKFTPERFVSWDHAKLGGVY